MSRAILLSLERHVARGFVFAVAASLALLGCAAPRVPTFDAAYCAPPALSHATWSEDPPTASSSASAASPASARRDRIAALLGLRTLTATAHDDAAARLLVLERIEAARLDIAASSAELDCEGERAEQIGDALADKEAAATKNLTVASLIAAAATGIASGILLAENASNGAQAAVAIPGAGVTGALGFAALVDHASTDFQHPRNLLADIWTGPKMSALYPPVVWAYLSRPEFSNDGALPIRAKIAHRWKSFGDLDDARAALLFGKGGRYDAGALHARSSMLNQVKAEVELLNQELAELTATPAPAAATTTTSAETR